MSNGGNQERQAEPAAIIALYHVTAEEVTRYRDYEWKIALWALLLIAAIIRLPELILLNHMLILQWLAFLFVTAVMISSVVLIRFCHKQFIKNSRVLRRCEGRLNLDDFKPPEWTGTPESIKFTHGIGLPVLLLILIGIFALYGYYSIFFW